MRTIIFSLLTIILTIGCSSTGKSASKGTVQKGDIQFEQLMADGDPPAMAIRKIVDGNVTNEFFGGRRSIQFEELITPEDKWHLGSNTKPMTSYLIGILIDQGKLSLDSRLSQLLPGYIPPGSGFEKVRVRDLLTHRAGLTEVNELQDVKAWTDTFNSREPVRLQRERLVKAILREQPKFPAGSKFEYSNSGYVVLGEIIEQITKQSWEQVMSTQLFAPLEMKGCGFGPSATKGVSPPDQPWGHVESNGKLITVQPRSVGSEDSENPAALGPSGTVHCDFDSWSKFLIEMLNASKGHSKLLKPRTAREFFRPYKDGVALGGWGARQREWAHGIAYTMSGSNGLNYALFVIAPQRNTILMAAANSGTDKTLKALTEALRSLSN